MNTSEIPVILNKLNNLIDDGRGYLQNMKEISSEISTVWKGDSGTEFLSNCTQWEEDIGKLVGHMDELKRELKAFEESALADLK